MDHKCVFIRVKCWLPRWGSSRLRGAAGISPGGVTEMGDYSRRYPASKELVNWAREEINTPARRQKPNWARSRQPTVRHLPESNTWRSPVSPGRNKGARRHDGAVTDRFHQATNIQAPWPPRVPTTPSRRNKQYASLAQREFTCMLPRMHAGPGGPRPPQRILVPPAIALTTTPADSLGSGCG